MRCFWVFLLLNFTCLFSIRTDPWITQDARKFLQEFCDERPNAKILEFGMGGSTIWFTKHTNQLTSIEHDLGWFRKVRNYTKKLRKSPNLIFHKRPYCNLCDKFPDESFDLILIDGRDRVKCLLKSIRLLKPGGVLMLDNSERHIYKAGILALKNWKRVITKQTKPDEYGFCYPKWQTDYWIKPQNSETEY